MISTANLPKIKRWIATVSWFITKAFLLSYCKKKGMTAPNKSRKAAFQSRKSQNSRIQAKPVREARAYFPNIYIVTYARDWAGTAAPQPSPIYLICRDYLVKSGHQENISCKTWRLNFPYFKTWSAWYVAETLRITIGTCLFSLLNPFFEAHAYCWTALCFRSEIFHSMLRQDLNKKSKARELKFLKI